MDAGGSRRRTSTSSRESEVTYMDERGKRLPNRVIESGMGDGQMEGKNIEEDVDDETELMDVDEEHPFEDIKQVRNSTSRAEERMKWWKVYALHFLFMWNTKTYEYASIVLVSSVFPQSLFATSIRGITSTLSAMFCASIVGSWIDRAPSRLPPLLISILSNHGAIVAAYICWLIWLIMAGTETDNTPHAQNPFSSSAKGFQFGLILVLDAIQHLSATGNKLSLERDWVPALVEPAGTSDAAYSLTQVNAVMGRIDLICKLVAPSLLPLIISKSGRTSWILLLVGATVVLGALEVWCAQRIAHQNSHLRLPKVAFIDEGTADDFNAENKHKGTTPGHAAWLQKLFAAIYHDPLSRLQQYFSMSIWPASTSISLLQMTVLAYSATLITYLLEVGFSLSAVTIARGSGSIMALAGTFITPIAVQRLRNRKSRAYRPSVDKVYDLAEYEGTIIRTVGIWGVSSQFLCMIPVVLVLWGLSPKADDSTSSAPHVLLTLTLFSFLSLSRIGHWMFELMIQELEQVEIPSSQRSAFAGTEQSFRSFFELCHWGATVTWSSPDEFGFLALGSLVFLGVGAGIFGLWCRVGSSARNGGEVVTYQEIAMEDVG